MKIYEMIFHKGTYERTNEFYTINNKRSRKHFIDKIRLELDMELNDFKINCNSEHRNDLLLLFKEVHQESHLHLNTMAKSFIQSSKAEFDQHICLEIKEHIVLSL
jgi:hypothetical protein